MVVITGWSPATLSSLPFLCCMPVQSREGKVEGNNGTTKSSTPTSIIKEKSKAERKRVSGRGWYVVNT